jgi:flagellar protein FliO/FliZ
MYKTRMKCDITCIFLFFILSFFVFSPLYADVKSESAKNQLEEKVKTDKVTLKKINDEKSKLKDNSSEVLSRDYKDEDFKPKVQEESYVWMVIKTIFIMGLMVGGFYYFFKFVTKKAGIQLLGHDVIQILSMVPVGPGKHLQVIDLAGKILVIGVADQSINLITEITEQEVIDRIRLLSSSTSPAKESGFQEFLLKSVNVIKDRVGNADKKPEEEDYLNETDLSYLKNQRSRLKKMNGEDNE